MKKFFLAIIFLSFLGTLTAQVKNVNPDPNGEPWIVGGWKELTKDEISKIPELKIPDNIKNKDLPASLDNSTLPYFRPVFSQTDGCCAQASGVAYNFTYEINRARGTSANTFNNQFPTHYTYNFLNGGSGSNGSNYVEGWAIIKANGCPTVQQYGGLAKDPTYWMSGYNLYSDAMQYRVTDVFRIDVSTAEGLENLKFWLYNHGDGSSTGGLVNFSAGINTGDFNMTYDNIITSWGESVNHAMTFVGWDDNIGYDVNNDGQITNNIDITGDGVVDMRDWERGAMIMVNSWGTYWGDNGKAYVLYRLLALPPSEGGIGGGNYVYSINVNPQFHKQIYLKVKMSHNCRNKIKVSAGVATDINASAPEYTLDFPLFNYQGGCYDMQGNATSAPIQFSLDVTPLLSYVDSGQEAKFFMIVNENDPYDTVSGVIDSLYLVDNAGNQYACNMANVPINNNSETTIGLNATINFDEQNITTENLPQGTVNQYYSQQLSAEGGESPYTWFIKTPVSETEITDNYPEISSNPITFTNNDDGYGMQVIDFKFPFYGKEYDTLYIVTDGSIRFVPGFDYIRTADAIKMMNIISPFASDLMIYDGTNQGVFYEGDSSHATFRWHTALWSDENANVDAAVTLYSDGTIKFFYNNGITQGLSWASGISAGDGFNYYITSYSGENDPSNMAVLLQPSAFPKGMLLSSDGEFYGTPKQDGQWNLIFGVQDARNIIKQKTLNFTVEPSNSILQTGNEIKIYPNPANSNFVVNSSEKIDKIEVVNLQGKICKTSKIVNQNKKIDVSTLPSGVYIVKIFTDTEIYSNKILIIH